MSAPDAAPVVTIPEVSLVVLVGVTSSGKSTFARAHFAPTEVVSSDECRALVADDENDQTATPAAFDLLHTIVRHRLALGRLTVVDATNLRKEDRRHLVDLAREHHVLPVAVVFDVPRWLCEQRNEARPDRTVPAQAIRSQHSLLRQSAGRLEREGFRRVVALRGDREVSGATVVRERLWTDQRHRPGPFDVIGDVHGCSEELDALLAALGYELEEGGGARHPDGRTAVFLGDLVDRGPGVVPVLRRVMAMVTAGSALCVPGNHEAKLLRALRGRNVKISHGLQQSLDQLAAADGAFVAQVVAFIDGLVSHAVLDGGSLVVAHAGLPEAMHNRASGAVRSFCLYGDTTGETDELGFPVRYPWAEDYAGRAVVVYGHTPVPEPVWVNNTICIDTGCVFGGRLTALRYPERALVSVPAVATHYAPTPGSPASDLAASGPAAEATPPDDAGRHAIDLARVLGRHQLTTSLMGPVTIRDDQAAAALEVMSRFAVDPRWLPYLPPTMAPAPTSTREGYLEHPAEAFTAYAQAGVGTVVAEEKHMGSRAVVLVGRDADALRRRFGLGGPGTTVTRTGRPFFVDEALGLAFLDAFAAAVGAAGLWDELRTDWLLVDAEIVPWSFKALDLLRHEYAPVASAGRAFSAVATEALARVAARGVAGADDLAARVEGRRDRIERFAAAYATHCWPTDGLRGVQVAPFQLLAAEGEVLAYRSHTWHLDAADRLVAADPGLVRPTRRVVVDTGDAPSCEAGTAWWLELVAAGGEGAVVKPLDGIVGKGRSLVQPGLKVRGPEYLRLIYGPTYDDPAQLAALRRRSLGHKRSLALRELALGLEGLDRLVRGASLTLVHQCAFAVLALETEPVDPRL